MMLFFFVARALARCQLLRMHRNSHIGLCIGMERHKDPNELLLGLFLNLSLPCF